MTAILDNKVTTDPTAWLVGHGDYLYRYAMFRLRDASAAEDAVQETLLAALQSHNRYQGNSSERTWLVGILKHKILDHYRRVSRANEVFGDDLRDDTYDPFETSGEWIGHWRTDMAPTDWHLNASQLLEKKEFWAILDRCLSELPERMAMAFTLREIEGLSSERVCEVLNISANNLWVLLHRARLKLRHSLEAEWMRSDSPKGERTEKRTPTAIPELRQSTATGGIQRALRVIQSFATLSVRFPRMLRLLGWSE